ncbi:MAG: NAD-binding protein, partial [Pseudomonadota bacterium]
DKKAIFIDCSTIEADMAKSIGNQLREANMRFCDAPVSGGVAGAAMGTLTFIVGGVSEDVEAISCVLNAMGQNVFHAGETGAGQIAKICNNMLLSVLMTATSEALQLGIDNGLDPTTISQILSKSSGNNWTLEKYNPCPGVQPHVPSSNNYEGGFLVKLMNKDLDLAMKTASLSHSKTPMGALAQSLFQAHQKQGNSERDFSSIFEMYANHTRQ